MSSTLLEALYALSDNEDLFQCLRKSGKVDEVPEAVDRSTVLRRGRDAILSSLKAETTADLDVLFRGSSDNDKAMLVGECILSWASATSSVHKKLLRDVIDKNLQLRPSGIHLRAWREWLSIYIGQLEGGLTPPQLLNLRYLMAAYTDQERPGLVGESFYLVGKAAAATGDMAKAKQCYSCVHKDLGNNLTMQIQNNLRFEVGGILHWYRLACRELMAMEPSQAAAIQAEMEANVANHSQAPAVTPTGAMWGPIAKTYMSRERYLGDLLDEIENATDLAAVCYKFDYCHEIDNYLFAIERFAVVLPIIPAQVMLSYEPEIQEAIDVLKRRKGDPQS